MTGPEQPEFLLHPELIKGSPFRHSVILTKEAGGFELKGLIVPLGWQKTGMVPRVSPSRMEEFLGTIFSNNYLGHRGRVVIDPGTGLLISVVIDTTPPSFLQLSGLIGGLEWGEYVSGFSDLRVAIAVQHLAAAFFSLIWENIDRQTRLAYIDGTPGNYGPIDLIIPHHLLQTTHGNKATTSQYRTEFAGRAGGIAQNFGLTLFSLNFGPEGILTDFEVKPGDRTEYLLGNSGHYVGHNVDTPEQAACLQAIGVTFVNDLLMKKLSDSVSDRRG